MDRIAFMSPLLSLLLAVSVAVAQSGAPSTITTNDQYYAYARFSPSMIVIIVVLVAAVFFMGFFSIYVRHCSSHSYRGPVGTILRAFSRRASAAFCGLDPSVLQTFPTLTYSEVREDNIGKGALECAVCLNEFKPDEALRWIPKCDHVFHPECIDAWLSSHVTCPVCRANLAPDPIADEHLPPPPPPAADERQENPSESDQIAVHVDDETPDRVGRRTSLSRAKVAFGFGWFRSHSTGHSVPVGVVRPGENLERFTLRLPEPVRREVIDRARLNRTGSCAVPGLPRGGSSRPNWAKSYRRIEREAIPDRWLFFSRGPSTKSPKATEAGESSRGGSRAPVKMPSFTCLEPKAADESSLFSPRRPTI